ncbi:hypothetical protein BDN70DRAFT_809400 [Pholiota conissans]|uniref:BTB domain-containing protein n=1 Tax=Pholiota conissans TaxID=109636 RepID=A0A9P5YZV0_9AGAR|nr:hypothetical protein BDN70DRAFT_809400 [Pholiota conissans]
MIGSSPEASAIEDAQESPKSSPSKSSSGSKSPSGSHRVRRHKRWYMYDGNIVIQVENTLFRLKLSTLHEHSPVFRNIVPPIQTGSLPIIGYNDRRPLVLYEVSQVDFVRLLPMLFPSEPQSPKKPATIHDLLSILKLATNFQMDAIRHMAMLQVLEIPMDPIRRIAIWDEFHLDSDLLLPSFAALCQRSEPLTLPMTMSLGIRNFTKVAAARDMYRQTVGCCECRQSLGIEESQTIADKIVAKVFAKQHSLAEKPML